MPWRRDTPCSLASPPTRPPPSQEQRVQPSQQKPAGRLRKACWEQPRSTKDLQLPTTSCCSCSKGASPVGLRPAWISKAAPSEESLFLSMNHTLFLPWGNLQDTPKPSSVGDPVIISVVSPSPPKSKPPWWDWLVPCLSRGGWTRRPLRALPTRVFCFRDLGTRCGRKSRTICVPLLLTNSRERRFLNKGLCRRV